MLFIRAAQFFFIYSKPVGKITHLTQKKFKQNKMSLARECEKETRDSSCFYF